MLVEGGHDDPMISNRIITRRYCRVGSEDASVVRVKESHLDPLASREQEPQAGPSNGANYRITITINNNINLMK